MNRLRPATLAVAPLVHAATRAHSMGSDRTHQYVNNPHVEQTEGTDPFFVAHTMSQRWLTHEQWMGYSDSYLAQEMHYTPHTDKTAPLGYPHKNLQTVFTTVKNYYGPAAKLLIKMEDDPLHPQFHEWLEQVRNFKAQLDKAIDENYKNLHPTFKTVWDAYVVKRSFTLADWSIMVEKQRNDILERLDEKYIAQQEKARGVIAEHVARLKALEHVIKADPLMLSGYNEYGLTHGEREVLVKNLAFRRKMKQFGMSFERSDKSGN